MAEAKSRYDELRSVYTDLIDQHQELKSKARDGDEEAKIEERRLIKSINQIEELLNQWAEEDEE